MKKEKIYEANNPRMNLSLNVKTIEGYMLFRGPIHDLIGLIHSVKSEHYITLNRIKTIIE